MRIEKLPKDAKYDYTNIFGDEIYHTKTRRYKVHTVAAWGRPHKEIYSEPLDKKEQEEQ